MFVDNAAKMLNSPKFDEKSYEKKSSKKSKGWNKFYLKLYHA